MHLHIRTYLHMYYTLTMQTRKFKGGNTYNCMCHKHQTILHIDSLLPHGHQCVFKCMHICVALCDMHGTAKHCQQYMVNLIEKDLYLVDVFDHTVH